MLRRRLPVPVIGAISGLAAAGLLLTAAAALPPPALAHGFGERYDLPLPLRFFVIAGAVSVALSFVIAAAFLRGESAAQQSYPRYNRCGSRRCVGWPAPGHLASCVLCRSSSRCM